MEYFNLLPEGITSEIISRVPTETVLECKLVCTAWINLIRHPSFSKMHFHHLNHPVADSGKLGFIALTSIDGWKSKNFQYFEYDENHESIEKIRKVNLKSPFGGDSIFLGSFNGLICLTPVSDETETYICNPITREYIMLPEINTFTMNVWATGFGYVASTSEYKFVTIVSEDEFMEVYIYTLGSGNGWRNLGKVNFETGGYWGEGIFASGVLYWLNCELNMIFPFNLAEEKFCEHMSLPLPPDYDSEDQYELGVLDGCLSFAINLIVNEAECSDVRLLKKKYANHGIERKGHTSMCWSEKFRVFDSDSFAFTKSYNVLTYNGSHINIHDLEASTSKTLVDFTEQFGGVFPHKNTLVSLKELGEEDTKIMESVEFEETEPGSAFQPALGG